MKGPSIAASGTPSVAPRPAGQRTWIRPEKIVHIFGVPFSAISCDEALQRIRGMLRGDASHHVVIANAHTLNIAYADETYRRILRNASLVLRDGVGVELAARLRGGSLTYNFVGTDFVPRLLADTSVRAFLYGSAPGLAVAAGRALADRNPHLRIVGAEHGYVSQELMVARIAAARPDVLLVALGNPLQERWIAANLARLNTRVAIGVGALFDNLAGRVPRAPAWVRRMRCEWIFRLCKEPGRLGRRYLIGNPAFVWRLVTTRGQEPW